MGKYRKLILIIINLSLHKLYCAGPIANGGADFDPVVGKFMEVEKIKNINEDVMNVIFQRSIRGDEVNITRLQDDLNNVIKYFPNENFKKNYDALLNAVGDEHKNETINEIINHLDIYGDIFSEEIDVQKLKEIFELIKNYDFKEHPTAREIFKTKAMKSLLKNLPTGLSKELVNFLDWAYKQWMKIPDKTRETLEQYITNAIKNYFRNTGLEKLLEDPGTIIDSIKINEKVSSIKNSLTKIIKEMVDAEKEKKYVKENYKNIKTIRKLLAEKKELETVRNMFDSGRFIKGLKKLGKDTVEVISCKKCARNQNEG